MVTNSALIVVAHPDDEVLGAGGTAWMLSQAGWRVRTCILSGNVDARKHRPDNAALLSDTLDAARILGMDEPILGDFPNIRMNTVPHLDLVQFIEQGIEESAATQIFTHHPNDLNDDHRQVSAGAQAAARLAARRPGMQPLQGLHYMEIPSSTDWAFPNDKQPFRPNSYVEIGLDALEAKLQALACYRGVMRPFPHPRSEEAIRGLAAVRGGASNLNHAEAFESVFVDLGSALGTARV